MSGPRHGWAGDYRRSFKKRVGKLLAPQESALHGGPTLFSLTPKADHS